MVKIKDKTMEKSDIKIYNDIFNDMVKRGCVKIVNIKIKYNKDKKIYTIKIIYFNDKARSESDILKEYDKHYDKPIQLNQNGYRMLFEIFTEGKLKTYKNLTVNKIRKTFTQSRRTSKESSALTTSELNATKKAIFEECVKGRDNSVWINCMTV